MSLEKSYYELLGVSKSSDIKTLKQAFHRLSKALHPDTTSLQSDDAAQKFRKVYEAYELLSDPLRRKAYDKELENKEIHTRIVSKAVPNSKNLNQAFLDNRRPLSGGELFSLLLLFIALITSVFLGISVSLLDGRELQVRPSWLVINQFLNSSPSGHIRNVSTSILNNSFKSAFIAGY